MDARGEGKGRVMGLRDEGGGRVMAGCRGGMGGEGWKGDGCG